ncbi:MAG TPA: maleylpyruvate isomerase N-terminal domain-containing protein [Candidatus Binatia bacterium]|jgi:hypothetical protein|nr:maleylpyruvate isomerase N-terminal domain-containing protein [Candidatus Binatia bacterium]
MNADDVMKYGNLTVLRTVDGLDYADWDTPDVCGVWSTREIIAHLASFEHMLVAVLNSVLDGAESAPLLDRYKADPLRFNDVEVAKRANAGPQEVFDEYRQTQADTMSLLARIPVERRRQSSILPWYGAEYDLEDFLAYSFYGHKREHCAQINVFRDTLKAQSGTNR